MHLSKKLKIPLTYGIPPRRLRCPKSGAQEKIPLLAPPPDWLLNNEAPPPD